MFENIYVSTNLEQIVRIYRRETSGSINSRCYTKSLLFPTYNSAAAVHICRLLCVEMQSLLARVLILIRYCTSLGVRIIPHKNECISRCTKPVTCLLAIYQYALAFGLPFIIEILSIPLLFYHFDTKIGGLVKIIAPLSFVAEIR